MEVSYFFWLKKGVAFFTDPLLLFSVLVASCLLFFKLNQNISFSIKKKLGYVHFWCMGCLHAGVQSSDYGSPGKQGFRGIFYPGGNGGIFYFSFSIQSAQ